MALCVFIPLSVSPSLSLSVCLSPSVCVRVCISKLMHVSLRVLMLLEARAVVHYLPKAGTL